MVQKLLGFVSSRSDASSIISGAPPAPSGIIWQPRPYDDNNDIVQPPPPLYYVPENAFKKKFISREKGHGLVATQRIGKNSAVFVDELIYVRKWEQDACKTLAHANTLIENKARNMGPDWYKKFISLSRAGDEKLGRVAAIWDRHAVPVSWNEKLAGVLGLNLASVNHSCAPNCVLSVTTDSPGDNTGKEILGATPQVGRATLHTCRVIKPGEEITMAYIYTRGNIHIRRRMTQGHLDFICACHACRSPDVALETVFFYSFLLEFVFCDIDTISDNPQMVLRAAFDVLSRYTDLPFYDLRVAMINVKCAVVAGHHSDIGRAYCFLARARQMAVQLQGVDSELYRQASRWFACPTLMPGFGATTRGLSSPLPCKDFVRAKFHENSEILFMLKSNHKEYVRMHRYRLRPGVAADSMDQKYDILPEEKMPLPPKISTYTEDPYCNNCDRNGCQMKDLLKCHGHNSKKLPKLKELCVDPEKDFLEAFMQVVHDFENPPPVPSDEEKEATQATKEPQEASRPAGEKGKGKKKKGKGKYAGKKKAQPVVKDVGAKKQVMMVERDGVMCPDESAVKGQ